MQKTKGSKLVTCYNSWPGNGDDLFWFWH